MIMAEIVGFTIVIKQVVRASHKAVPTGLNFDNAFVGRGFASFTPPYHKIVPNGTAISPSLTGLHLTIPNGTTLDHPQRDYT